jgi:hypothetical protein
MANPDLDTHQITLSDPHMVEQSNQIQLLIVLSVNFHLFRSQLRFSEVLSTFTLLCLSKAINSSG